MPVQTPVLADAALARTAWCVVRPQVAAYLVYNTRTDELHLLPPAAYYVYGLCDGLNTAADIERIAGRSFAEPQDAVAARVREMLDGLIARGLIAPEAVP